ncbi:MAG: sigma 54-interacting transcriptional regulator [Nitrospirae bacterium]|nr:sigma 54-interacting transcriptional regulator [Nitrospirota bacterium]
MIWIDRFEVLKELGEGSFGRVVLAHDRVQKRTVAVKQFLEQTTELLDPSSKREMEFLSHLDHPAFVKVFDLVTDPATGTRYLTQEYVEGEGLSEFLKRAMWDDRLRVFVQLLAGLEYLHSRGLIHLDIKPSNVRMSAANESGKDEPAAKILDFGVADEIGKFDLRGRIAGTFPYMAPEVAGQEHVDGRADLYSLAMVFFDAFSLPHRRPGKPKLTREGVEEARPGRPDAPTTKADETSLDELIRETRARTSPRPGDFLPDVPEAFRDILITLLDPNPRRRFWSANEVIRRLNARLGRHDPLEPGRLRIPDKSTAVSAGRTREIQELTQWAQQAEQSTNALSVALVRGKSQSGKSAVLDEFRRWAEMKDLSVIGLMRMEEGGTELFEPLLAGAKDPEIDLYAPFLKAFLPARFAEVPDPTVLDTSPDLQKARAMAMCGEAFRLLVRDRPVVVVADDVDRKPELAELLASAAAAVRAEEPGGESHHADMKVLILLGASDLPPSSMTPDRTLELRSWSKEEVSRAVGSLLGIEEVPHGFLQKLMAQTEGMPGLVVEVVRFLVDRLLRPGEDIAAQMEMLDWRRLDERPDLSSWYAEDLRGLETDERTLLEWTCLFPLELDASDLAALDVAPASEAARALRRLVDRGWLAEGAGGFQFASRLRRDTVLKALDSERRTQMHRALGEAWDSLSASRRETGSALLQAEQFFLGGEAARAFALARSELQMMLRLNQPAPVADFLTTHRDRALELASPAARAYDLLLAQSLLATADFTGAIEAYRVLLTGASGPDEQAELVVHLSRALRFGGKLEEAARTIREFKERSPEGERMLPRLDSLYADVVLEQARYGEAAAISRAYLEGKRLCDPDELMAFRHVLAKVHFYQKETDRAIELFKQNCAEGRRSGRMARYALSLNALGAAYLAKDATPEAIESLHSCATLSQEIGDLRGTALANLNLGVSYQKSGNAPASETHYEKALVVFRQIGAEADRARALFNLGLLRMSSGNLEGAEESFSEALKLSSLHGMTHLQARVRLERAVCFLTRGRLQEAKDESEGSQALFEGLGMEPNVLEAKLVNLEIRLRVGEVGGVETALGEYEEAVMRQGSRELEVRFHSLRSQVLTHRKEGQIPALPPFQKGGDGRMAAASNQDEPTLAASGVDAPRKGISAGPAPTLGPPRRRRTDAETLSLLDLLRKINSPIDFQETLVEIVDSLVAFNKAERGFLLLLEEGQLKVRVARSRERREIRDPEESFSLSVAQETLAQGQPLFVIDATADPRFNRSASVTQLGIRSVLGIPLFLMKGKPIGALYLDTQLDQGHFMEEDGPLLSGLSELTALAIYKAQLIAQNIRDQRELRKTVRELNESKGRIEELAADLEEANGKLREKVTQQEKELDGARERLSVLIQDEQPKYRYDRIVGTSPAIRRVLSLLDRAVDSRVPVLIEGESGTGKELLARAIHFNSARKDKPFVPLNCAAVPYDLFESELFGHVKGAFTGADRNKPGLFEVAHGGTLFLDEIGEMPLGLQVKLLRALEERAVRPVGGTGEIQLDVRIVAATNKDLRELIERGQFREDLYYRLCVFHVPVPPLRERGGDIPLLVDAFLKEIAREEGGAPKSIAGDALALLSAYRWPGNVRELENTLRNAYVVCATARLEVQDFRHKLDLVGGSPVKKGSGAYKLKDVLEEVQVRSIRDALLRTGGNISLAAVDLGVNRSLLSGWVKKWRLKGGGARRAKPSREWPDATERGGARKAKPSREWPDATERGGARKAKPSREWPDATERGVGKHRPRGDQSSEA